MLPEDWEFEEIEDDYGSCMIYKCPECEEVVGIKAYEDSVRLLCGSCGMNTWV